MSTSIDQLMRQADPMDFYELPPATGARDDDLYLAILSRRGHHYAFDEKPSTKTEQQPRRQRRGWVVAAGAFAIVLVVGVILTVSLLTGTEPEPATPPTTIAPATTEAAATTTEAPAPTTAAATAAPETTTTVAPTTTTVVLPDYPVSSEWEVSTIVLGVPAREGESGSLSLDSAGNLYVGAFADDSPIYRVDTNGAFEVWAQPELLRRPSASTFGPDGRLYVSSFNNGHILALSEDGTAEVITDQLTNPSGLVFTEDGRLFASDMSSNAILEVLPDGSAEQFVRDPFFNGPTSLAIDEDGNIYVSNQFSGRIHRVTPEGEVAELHQFDGALGIAYLDGQLFISGWGSDVVYRMLLEDGSIEIIAGNGSANLVDGIGIESAMADPDRIVIGPDGELYINHSIDGGGDEAIAIRVIRKIG